MDSAPPIRTLPSVVSTNDEVARWIREGCPHGSALRAEAQSGGRGRLGRTWHSPANGNLYLSIALRPPSPDPLPRDAEHASAQLFALVPLAAGVAAVEAIHACIGLRVDLKWPNDLLVGPRKLGGVLCEGVFDAQRLRGIVVGLGINVVPPDGPRPDSLLLSAVGLSELVAEPVEAEELAVRIRERMLSHWNDLCAGDPSAVLAAWRERDAARGRRVRAHLGPDPLEGVADGIDDDGSLRVLTGDGRTRSVRSGEVHFLHPEAPCSS